MVTKDLKRSKIISRGDTTSIYLEEGFFDRKGIFQDLYSLAIEGRRKAFLYGRPKVGKTELLIRLYRSLFHHQDKVIPFYYAFPEYKVGIYDLCKDYLTEFIRQYIAFIRNDSFLLKSGTPLRRLQQLLDDSPLPSNLVDDLYEQIDDGNHLGVVKVAFSAPSLLSSTENARFCLILDDFHHLTVQENRILFRELSRTLVESGLSCILSGYLTPWVKAFTGRMAGHCMFIELGEIPEGEIMDLIHALSTLYKVRLKKEDMIHILKRLGFNPFYIKITFDALKERGMTLTDLKDFYTIYFDEMTSGRIYHYLSTILLGSTAPSRRKTVLTFLKAACEGRAEWRRFFATPEEPLIQSLLMKGVLEGELNDLKVKDPTLRDFVEIMFQKEVEGESLEEIRARGIWQKLKEVEEERSLERLKGTLLLCKRGIEGFLCQKVPQILFDYGAFRERFGEGRPRKDELEGKELYLPKMVSTYCKDGLIVGYGFEGGLYREDKVVVWIAGCLSSPVVSESEAIEFLEKASALERAIGKETAKWAIAEKGFSRAAEEMLKGADAFRSNHDQLSLLLSLLKEEKVVEGKEPHLFEIILPALSEVELIAARAVEEMAKKANIDEESISQIKMALIEACINASEYGRKGNGKIHIKILLEGEGEERKLTIYVENEGGDLKPYLVSEPSLEEKMGSTYKRGWGFKLMRVLMDEVSFDKWMGRTRLKMVKYIR